MALLKNRGGRNPFRAMKFLGADCFCKRMAICFVAMAVWHCACEGSKQRFVPTGLATGDNEVKQHRNFSETHFPGVAPCRFRLDGHDGNAVWDEAVPMYVTRLGDLIEKSAQRNLF